MRIVVYHGYYGCETGCCGHVIEWEDESGKGHERFEFSHPWNEDIRKYAEDWVTSEFGAEHVKDLDWENCFITNDC